MFNTAKDLADDIERYVSGLHTRTAELTKYATALRDVTKDQDYAAAMYATNRVADMLQTVIRSAADISGVVGTAAQYAVESQRQYE